MENLGKSAREMGNFLYIRKGICIRNFAPPFIKKIINSLSNEIYETPEDICRYETTERS
jgi:hypothetical protein